MNKPSIDLSNIATEKESLYSDLHNKTTNELIQIINFEDAKVALAVEQSLPQIEKVIDVIIEKMSMGGRLFYIGTGTSGRIGIVDASEMLPTYGLGDKIIGLMAGGDSAIRTPVERAEDSEEQAYKDLLEYGLSEHDVVLGCASSGRTPYVVHGLRMCRENGISTACFVCSPDSQAEQYADHPIQVLVGPEVVTGSTRMKSGTAQKMVLNIISTTLMIKLGRVVGNRMVRMTPTNNKLWQRAINMVQLDFPDILDEEVALLLEEYKGVVADVKAYLAAQK